MNPVIVRWEVYASRAQAVEALPQSQPQPQPRTLPAAKFPLLVMEDIGGVTCIQYDYKVWTANVAILQSQLKALVTQFGLDRVVLDFGGQNKIGTTSMACVAAICSGLLESRGKVVLCNVSPPLFEIFQIHGVARRMTPR